MKMTDAVRLTTPLGELNKKAGVVLFHAPSEEILLYPDLAWSSDGRLAFLSRSRAGQNRGASQAGPKKDVLLWPSDRGTSAPWPSKWTSKPVIPVRDVACKARRLQ